MSNLIRSTTELALYLARAYAKPGMTVVDATCGNGYDTLALAEMNPDRLYAFDIQPVAVEATRKLLRDNGFCDSPDCLSACEYHFICDSHLKMAEYVASADIILFNLGYLPGGDKSITTSTETTLDAVKAALEILNIDGVISITMYSGHEAGANEKARLLEFTKELDSHKYHVAYIGMHNQANNPPEILLITRKN